MSKVSLNDFPWKHDVELAHAFGVPLHLEFSTQPGGQGVVRGNFLILNLITSERTPESAEQRQAVARAAYKEMDARRVEKEQQLGQARGKINKRKEDVLLKYSWLRPLISEEMEVPGEEAPTRKAPTPGTSGTSGTSGVFRIPAVYDTADIWFGRRHSELDAWTMKHRGALKETPDWVVALTRRDGVAGEQARALFGDALEGVEGKIQPLLKERLKENGKDTGYAIKDVFGLISKLNDQFSTDPSFRPNSQDLEVMQWINAKGASLADTPDSVAKLTQLSGKTGERARALYGDSNTKRPGFLQISAVQARLTPKPRMNPRRNPNEAGEGNGDEAYIVKAEYSALLRSMTPETIEKIKQKIRDTFPAESAAKIEFFDKVLAAQSPAAGSLLSVLNAQEEAAQKGVDQIVAELNKMRSTSRLAPMPIQETRGRVRYGSKGPTYSVVIGPSRWALAAQSEEERRKSERRPQKVSSADVLGMSVRNSDGDVYNIIFKDTQPLTVSLPSVPNRLLIRVSPDLQTYFNFLGALGINLDRTGQKAISSSTLGADAASAASDGKKVIKLQVMSNDSNARFGWSRDKNTFIFILGKEYPPLARLLSGTGGQDYERQVRSFQNVVSSPSDVIIDIDLNNIESLEKAMLPLSALLMRTAGISTQGQQASAQAQQTTAPIEDWSMVISSQSRGKNTEISLVLLRDFSKEASEIFERGAAVLNKVNAALADIQENEFMLPFLEDKSEAYAAINTKKNQIEGYKQELRSLGLFTQEYRPLQMSSGISFSLYLPRPSDRQLALILGAALRHRLPTSGSLTSGNMVLSQDMVLDVEGTRKYSNEILSQLSYAYGPKENSRLTQQAMSYYVKDYGASPLSPGVQLEITGLQKFVDEFNKSDEEEGTTSANERMDAIKRKYERLQQRDVLPTINRCRLEISLLRKEAQTPETKDRVAEIKRELDRKFSEVLAARNNLRNLVYETTRLALKLSKATILLLESLTHNIFWQYSATLSGSHEVPVRKLIPPQAALPGSEQEGKTGEAELPEEGALLFYLLSFPSRGGMLSSPDRMMNFIFSPDEPGMYFEYDNASDARNRISNVVAVLNEAQANGIPMTSPSMTSMMQRDKTFASLMQLSGAVWTGKRREDREQQLGFYEKKDEVFYRMVRTWGDMGKNIVETANQRLPQIAQAGDYADIPGNTEIYGFVAAADEKTGKTTIYRLDMKDRKSRQGYKLIPTSENNRLLLYALKDEHPQWLAPPFAKVSYRTSEDAYYSEASAEPVGGRQDLAVVAEAAARKAARKAGAQRPRASMMDVDIDLDLFDDLNADSEVVRVLFSGSRDFSDDAVVKEMLEDLLRKNGSDPTRIKVIHGGAPGLDSIVGNLAKAMGMLVEVHPADWKSHGKAAGPIRNQNMVNLGADLLVAYPSSTGTGTQDCINKAVKANIRTLVFDPAKKAYFEKKPEGESEFYGSVAAKQGPMAGYGESDPERAAEEARAKRAARAELGRLLPFPVSNMMHFDKNITYRTADGRVVDQSLSSVLQRLNDKDDSGRAKKLARLWLVRAGELLTKNEVTWEDLSMVYGHSKGSMIPYVATLFGIPRPASREAFVAAAMRERNNIDTRTSAQPPTEEEIKAKAERAAKAAERRASSSSRKPSGSPKRKSSLLDEEIDF